MTFVSSKLLSYMCLTVGKGPKTPPLNRLVENQQWFFAFCADVIIVRSV